MSDNTLHSIVESLNKDLEEKIQQLSQVRLFAENMVALFADEDYFYKLCANLVEIFQCDIAAMYWYRRREPVSWWLQAWASKDNQFEPINKVIDKSDEGILGEVKRKQQNLFVEESGDEFFLKSWQPEPSQNDSIAFIPISGENQRQGVIALVAPYFKLSIANIKIQLDIISSLINSAIRNRLLYLTLQNSEAEFRDLYENSSDMILVLYPDGIINDCNNLVQKKLELDESPQGKPFVDIVADESREVFYSSMATLLSGVEVKSTRLKLLNSSQEIINVNMSGNVRFLPDGRPSVIRVYLHEPSDQENFVSNKNDLPIEVLQRGQLAQLGLYLSEIIHNLQNPISVVLGISKLLNYKNVGLPELETLDRSATKIKAIIDNLLQNLKHNSSQATSQIDLNSLINSELESLEANPYFKYQIEKEINLSENIPRIKGLYADFSQIIMNLINNSLDAMLNAEKKILSISTAYDQAEDVITIAIKDSGHGIPEEIQAKIFEPFFTTKANMENFRGDNNGGSGLGLAGAKSLLKPYDAELSFTSEENQGTTFFLKIPRIPLIDRDDEDNHS